MYFTHFLALGVAGDLCVGVRNPADAMRPKLSVIEASRVLFESTDGPGVPRAITQTYVRAEDSHTIPSTRTDFIGFFVSGILGNGRIQCLRRRLSRRASKSVGN